MRNRKNIIGERNQIVNHNISRDIARHESEFNYELAFLYKESVLKAKAHGLIAGQAVSLYRRYKPK